MTHRATKPILYGLFLLSGATALTYELIWTRTFALIFGSTVLALSTVLASLFGGLALGSHLVGRLLDRRPLSPIRTYAVLEVGVGAYAFLFLPILAGLEPLYVELARLLSPSPPLALARLVLSSIILLPPSLLMGGTLPALAKGLVTSTEEAESEVGRLYGLNTLGAVVGTFLTAFFAIGLLGVRNVLFLAAGINILVSIVAFLMAKGDGGPGKSGPRTEDRRPGASRSPVSGQGGRGPVGWLLTIYFWSGFAALGYEVVWTRVLIHHVDNTIYAFGMILVVFLTGLGLGSLIWSWWGGRIRRPYLALALLEAAIGLSALATLWTLSGLPLIERLGPLLGDPTWVKGTVVIFVKVALLLLPPTLAMGMAFPLVAGLVTEALDVVGQRVGSVYAANTAGTILGSLAAGFILIPALGTGGTVRLLVVLNLLLALAVLYLFPGRRTLMVGAVVGGLGLLGFILSPDGYFRGYFGGREVLFLEEGASGTVAVVEEEDPLNPPFKRLFVDGNSFTSTFYKGKRYMRLLAHVPILIHPDPRRVLVIGFGSGMTAGAAAVHHQVEDVAIIELSATVMEAAPLFTEANDAVLQNSKTRVILGDGRNYLLTTRERFDVITAEPPPPRAAGVVNLYSLDFYRLVRGRLHPGGLVTQWIPIHGLSEEDIRMLMATFQAVFPHTLAWITERSELCLVGALEPITPFLDQLAVRMAQPAVRASLSEIGITRPEELLATVALDSTGVAAYTDGAPLVTDDHPYVEFFLTAPQDTPLFPYLRSLDHLLIFRIWPSQWLELTGADSARMARQEKAMTEFFQGVMAGNRGQIEQKLVHFRRAHRQAPENGFLQHLLGLSAAQEARAVAQVTARPGDGGARARRGEIAFLRGRYREAVRDLGAAVRLDPGDGSSHILLARAQEALGEWTAALETYRQATAWVPGDLPYLGQQVVKLRASLSQSPGEAQAWEGLSLALWRMERYDEAAEAFHRLVALRPEYELGYYNLAATLEADGRPDEALAAYRQAYRLNPTVAAANNIEKLELRQALAGPVPRRLVLDPEGSILTSRTHPEAYLALARRYRANGELPPAVEALDKARFLAPDSPEVALLMAQALLDLGLPELARQEARRARKLGADRDAVERVLRDAGS